VIQIGIDFGGTKIEAAALDGSGHFLHRQRVANPGSYEAALEAVRSLVEATEARLGAAASIGIGTPGSLSPRSGTMRNSNSTYLNGRAFREDVERALGREVRMANDANCLALSEAVDGAAAGERTVFAVIVGTGCGGGLVVDGAIVDGANGIAGEWGHVPLPWASDDEHPGPDCWCSQRGCLETWISGTGFRADHRRRSGQPMEGAAIVQAARRGDRAAAASLYAYADRLARALAMIVNILDPDCFVLGGGMSNVDELYDRLPDLVPRHTFSDLWSARIVPAQWGDSSGVRGAARLWPGAAQPSPAT
jgi:fructokinase